MHYTRCKHLVRFGVVLHIIALMIISLCTHVLISFTLINVSILAVQPFFLFSEKKLIGRLHMKYNINMKYIKFAR